MSCWLYKYWFWLNSVRLGFFNFFHIQYYFFNVKYSEEENNNQILTKIIINPDILSNHDKEQLSIAIENDDYALIDGTEVMKESVEFEKQIQVKKK